MHVLLWMTLYMYDVLWTGAVSVPLEEGCEEPHIEFYPEVLLSLWCVCRRSLEIGKYFDVDFEEAQAANWHPHSGTPRYSLASQGWCWQCCCGLCWCYLETKKCFFLLVLLPWEKKAGCWGTTAFFDFLLFCPENRRLRMGDRNGETKKCGYKPVGL